MSTAKPSRRKNTPKLEPIDWHEFANDAVLNGNMSTLYQRPSSEDASAYASPEALREIEKRTRNGPTLVVPTGTSVESVEPTVGLTVSIQPPTVGLSSGDGALFAPPDEPTVGVKLPRARGKSLEQSGPTVGMSEMGPLAAPTVGLEPTVGLDEEPVPDLVAKGKIKPLRDVQDALTLAGHVLYKAMYGAPDGARSKLCAKGYRQLANETHLDKDTVRDLIVDFKAKGMVREVATYDPDTRSAKSYDVLSYKSILQLWREAGLRYVTTGRKRPIFCTPEGEPLPAPTLGVDTPPRRERVGAVRPTVGLMGSSVSRPTVGIGVEFLGALEQITGNPVDHEAANRLILNCRTEAADCTLEEIIEFAWSKAFLCRSGKIANPIGFLIVQVPKHFQGEALLAYREKKRKELEAAEALASNQDELLQQTERDLAEQDARHQRRVEIAERHRAGHGIDLTALLSDPDADETLREWSRRMQKHGRYHPKYE